MDNNLVIKKIQALLHDPPKKPVILGRIAHEGRAREIMGRIIDEVKIPGDVKTADHIASAADRINLPKDERFITDFRKNPVIIHPLSGKEFDLKSLMQIEMEDITSDVDRSIVFLADKYKGDKGRLYLALWRELLECLVNDKDSKSELGQLWELLPADTRIPDHSIWEHKRITSALAGALPKPAFLLFSIGPVQDFIATARKTQDLWAGSYLLSYLSWSAMKTVADEFGPDSIIFPDLCRQPFADIWLKNEKGLDIKMPDSEKLSSPTLPNRFLAVIPEGSVKGVAEKAKKAVRDAFGQICSAVKDRVAKRLNIRSGKWDDIWQRQTKGFMETYWASVSIDDYKKFLNTYKPLMGISGDWRFDSLLKEYEEKSFNPNIGTLYGQIYRMTEKILESRKAVRDFSPQGEPNHKCTLCGVREPVHPGIDNSGDCSKDFGALQGFWRETVMGKFPQIRKSERLCAVCLSKRFSSKLFFKEIKKFDIDDLFPSVSIIASASFKLRVIEHIDNLNLSFAVEHFVEAVKNLADERWKGKEIPMVKRACRDQKSRGFAMLEGDWLYREMFENKKTLWEESKQRLSEEEFNMLFKKAKEAQKFLFDKIKEFEQETGKRIGSPSKYYAVLLMDGDDMGKWLSGENAPKINDILHPIVREDLDDSWDELKKMERPLSPSLHLSMSKALRDFSLHVVREIVEYDHLGKLVYAGGDDVLAFVNLRDLPEVMRKLRAYFSGSLKVNTKTNKVDIDIDFKEGSGFVPLDADGHPVNVGSGKPVQGFLLSMGTKATASMGVVIAHHSANLTKVLDEVRSCEKKAKKVKDKNAFCIALAKRAGGTEYTTAKWYYDLSHPEKGNTLNNPPLEKGGAGGIFESIPLLRDWANAFYNRHISPKFVYTFRTETGALESLPKKAIRLELLRLANRQRNKKAEGFNEEKMKALVEGIMNLHVEGIKLDDMGKFLSVAEFLGREGNR